MLHTLGGNEIYLFENPQSTQSDIFKVSKGSRNHIKNSLSLLRFNQVMSPFRQRRRPAMQALPENHPTGNAERNYLRLLISHVKGVFHQFNLSLPLSHLDGDDIKPRFAPQKAIVF